MLVKLAMTLSLVVLGIFEQPIDAHQISPEIEHINMAFIKSAWKVDHDLFILHAIPKCGTYFIQGTMKLMTGQETLIQPLSIQAMETACLNNSILRIFQPYEQGLAALLKKSGHKMISIIRDPRDALISHVFYMREFAKRPNGGTPQRDFFVVGENFDKLSLDEQITLLIKGGNGCMSYIDFYKERIGWALSPTNFAVKYEELVGEKGGGNDLIQRKKVKQMAKFINLKLTEEKLNYVLSNMYVQKEEKELDDGRVFERATKGNWRTFLSAKHKKMIKEKIGNEMILLGYAKDNNW